VTEKKWLSAPPKTCDLCGGPINNEFIDGQTVYGPWGNMCPKCHKVAGIGLGMGRGQHYRKNGVGEFIKVEG
jgi:hypothetical protein